MNCFWKQHEFQVFDAHQVVWNDVPGIYIFPAIVNDQWKAMYVGQAKSLKDRLGNHERWGEARLRSVRHIHAMVVPLQADRDRIEEELIRTLQPKMNTMLKGEVPIRSLGLGMIPTAQRMAHKGIGIGPKDLNAEFLKGFDSVRGLGIPSQPPTGNLLSSLAQFGLPPRK